MKVQGTTEINAPPEKVWPFLVEPDRILKWYTLLQRFEYTGKQRGGVGTTFYMEEKAAVLMKLNFEVSEWTENRALAFRMNSGNFVKGYEQRWTLEPTAGGTRFILAEDVRLPYGPLGRLLGLFARSSSQTHVKDILGKLKALTEQETAAAPAIALKPLIAVAPVGDSAETAEGLAEETASGLSDKEQDVKRGADLIDIEGIGPTYAEKLGALGLKTTDDLLHAGASPKGREELASATGISGKLILRWVNQADLFRVKGVGEEYADLLEAAGVDTVPELAQRRADNLTKKMAEVNEEKKLVRRVPSESQVAGWIESAKVLPRVVSY